MRTYELEWNGIQEPTDRIKTQECFNFLLSTWFVLTDNGSFANS